MLENMLNPLKLVRLVKLVKPAALPGPRTVPMGCPAWTCSARRHSDTRRRNQEDASEEDLDMDGVEGRLGSLVREEKIKWKATQFHKIRRQMSERGPTERRLTWDAIEQIRYLKKESPQEWTVQRLAESYSVSPDVISRVLRSKFTPPPERKLKQDSKALTAVGRLSLENSQTDRSRHDRKRLPVPAGTVQAKLSEGTAGALMALSPKALSPAESETRLVPSVPSRSRGTFQLSTITQNTSLEESDEKRDVAERLEGLEKMDDTEWDGVFLTGKELEELVETLHEKPSAVEQKGREFFDSKGNFLYRI